MIYPKIISRIKESGKIGILSHIMPDGDSIGSGLALYNALLKYGKNVRFILDDDVPRVYKFLKNSEKVERPVEYESFDTVVVLDCGDAERLGKAKIYLENNFVINIDHHISNNEFGKLNMVDTNAAATGEIIYQIIKILGISMDAEISECLYTAIVTDTGQFRYSNTTSVTHQIAGDLINNGVNPSLAYERIYQSNTKEKVNLMKIALNSLEFYHSDCVACISLTLEQIKEANAEDRDTEGIIDLARDIAGVEAAIFLKELEPGMVKVGLRSKNKVDVAAVAALFGGGGHIRAAGCTVRGSVPEVRQKILEAVISQIS